MRQKMTFDKLSEMTRCARVVPTSSHGEEEVMLPSASGCARARACAVSIAESRDGSVAPRGSAHIRIRCASPRGSSAIRCDRDEDHGEISSSTATAVAARQSVGSSADIGEREEHTRTDVLLEGFRYV